MSLAPIVPATPRPIDVLVDAPGGQGLYSYAVPPGLTANPGDIVSVPFGSQQLGGIVLGWAANQDNAEQTLKPIVEVIAEGFFPKGYWSLLQRVADYYHTPLIQVVRTALPPGLLGRSQRRIRLRADRPTHPPKAATAQALLTCLEQSKDGDYSWRYLQQQVRSAAPGLRELLTQGWVESYLEPPTSSQPKRLQCVVLVAQPTEPLTDRQQQILDCLQRYGGELWLSQLLQLTHLSSTVVKALEKKQLILIESREVLRLDPGPPLEPDRPKDLTPDQTAALANLLAHIESSGPTQSPQILLHGVTGSGKTEVYLQAIAPILARRQSALVLVPEIGLTPQLTDRFRQRFGARVRVYHSGLSDGERYDTWRQILQPEPQIIIGTRSAIFAPLANLGLIILDEEHDSSFKQDQPMPCYHARTIAQWRANQAGCPLILGSATPALETWQAVVLDAKSDPKSQTQYLSLPRRVHDRPAPPVDVVDMRQELQEGNRSIFSRKLQKALNDIQAQGKQGLLFIHRRGHSTFVSCRSCGHVMDCPNCDVSLTYHQPHSNAAPLLRCHYCNHAQPQPATCPSCDSDYLKHFGSGTQRVAQELDRLYPNLRTIRFDSDTTRTKGAHRTLLTQFANGEADLLVGTQMLTKGLDIPEVTLVGIISADGLLHQSDFRAAERACQTLIQVAGRSGRGDEPGRVILQTYTPDDPVIRAVKGHAYQQFIDRELTSRTEQNYPPFGRLILLRFSSPDPTHVEQGAEAIATYLQDFWQQTGEPVDLLGPAPAPIERVAQRYRWQLLLKFGPTEQPLLPSLELLRSQLPNNVSLLVDVDPLNLS
jgi:primosomal protein N' (replication factor Y) (superfamily II helicase)